jgi:hypothetical protein
MNEGRYKGIVKDHGFDEYGDKKSIGLKIEFKVVAEFDETEDAWYELDDSAQVNRNLIAWFTDKSAKNSIANLRKYVEWEGEDLAELGEGGLVDNEIEVVCKGKDKGGYDDFDFPHAGGGGVAHNKDALKAARMKFGKLAKRGKGEKPPMKRRTKSEEAAEAPADTDNDDVAF